MLYRASPGQISTAYWDVQTYYHFQQGEQPTHNPEPPVGYNRRDLTPPRREPCPFFNKTGTCRFGVQCSR
ncbi:U2 small nuclear ribonucleoprotein auxiliary factor subunit-related protein 1 [Portunus trituberculatus]|uniref:U2 small nuclear ribonucleoprotein auxiliary factor subunit-related protein 1 n=1 Tax=Portunus trituberculatus TaxID=210409 RepID=A0A5B7ERM0_PORTR|nr:U2 small nuclear ribonucleoprotein auxiliary factor subunit-related protein 1 [Portunus trituberculatus]